MLQSAAKPSTSFSSSSLPTVISTGLAGVAWPAAGQVTTTLVAAKSLVVVGYFVAF